MKNSVGGFNSKFEQKDEGINELKERIVEVIYSEKQKGGKIKERQIKPTGPMRQH